MCVEERSISSHCIAFASTSQHPSKLQTATIVLLLIQVVAHLLLPDMDFKHLAVKESARYFKHAHSKTALWLLSTLSAILLVVFMNQKIVFYIYVDVFHIVAGKI